MRENGWLRLVLYIRCGLLCLYNIRGRGTLGRELVFEGDLHCLPFLVEVDVCYVVPIEGEVLLAHRVRREQRLIHAIWDNLPPLALISLGLWLGARGKRLLLEGAILGPPWQTVVLFEAVCGHLCTVIESSAGSLLIDKVDLDHTTV